MKIPISPAVALVKDEKYVCDKRQHRGLRQEADAPVIAAAQSPEPCEKEQAGNRPYPHLDHCGYARIDHRFAGEAEVAAEGVSNHIDPGIRPADQSTQMQPTNAQ